MVICSSCLELACIHYTQLPYRLNVRDYVQLFWTTPVFLCVHTVWTTFSRCTLLYVARVGQWRIRPQLHIEVRKQLWTALNVWMFLSVLYEKRGFCWTFRPACIDWLWLRIDCICAADYSLQRAEGRTSYLLLSEQQRSLKRYRIRASERRCHATQPHMYYCPSIAGRRLCRRPWALVVLCIN